jgi:XTP/dITP diphosphohydrolase
MRGFGTLSVQRLASVESAREAGRPASPKDDNLRGTFSQGDHDRYEEEERVELKTTIYAATGNANKLREFAECAALEGVEVKPLPGLQQMAEPVEDAATFMGNAELKAVGYSQMAVAAGHEGLLVFADDSGLEVEALGGQPGVHSARFADDLNWRGEALTRDERNNACLLSMLRAVPAPKDGESVRAARFVCALAMAKDGNILLRAEAAVEGELLDAPRGTDGFGYDPLFLVPSYGKTMAELRSDEKWSVSHRGKAFRQLLEVLKAG